MIYVIESKKLNKSQIYGLIDSITYPILKTLIKIIKLKMLTLIEIAEDKRKKNEKKLKKKYIKIENNTFVFFLPHRNF